MHTPNLDRLLALIPSEWSRNDYILCGSAPLALRGIRDVGDLDLLIRPKLWPSNHPEGREAGYACARPVLRLDSGIDMFDALPRLGADIPDPWEHFETLRGYQCLPLRHVLAIKAMAPPHPKHTADIRRIARLL